MNGSAGYLALSLPCGQNRPPSTMLLVMPSATPFGSRKRRMMPVETRHAGDTHLLSLLELHILSLLDRGSQTSYDFLQQGVSLGSSVPALRRMEDAGWIRAKRSSEVGKRQRHSFSLTAKGRKLVVRAGAGLLRQPPPADFDAVLRVIDIAQGIDAKAQDILAFLQAAMQDRRSLAKLAASRDGGNDKQLEFRVIRNHWDIARLKAEARLIAQIIKSLA